MTASTDDGIELLAAAARRRERARIARQRRLIANLKGDLARHGDPEWWKRAGDLLLANASTATRVGHRVVVTDYFDPTTPTVEIEGAANKSVAEIAESYFRRYTKARNGLEIIKRRMAETEEAVKTAEALLARIDQAELERDEEFLTSLTKPKRVSATASRPPKKADKVFTGARRFVSSDGFEILVGKKAKDNDHLTFRVARSLDLWLHAADYPGSHVVVRGSGRKELPHRTLVEAAQLAAFYSDAREMPKAAVRYTQKKFVNKPKRAAAGLVSLASFKTIMVEPKVPFEREE